MKMAVVVAKFLSMWIGFVAILIVVALLVDINWAKPFVQQKLTEILHRKVELGRLTWSFGLNGLAIDTTSIAVSDLDGKPFLRARDSEIGIAVTHLVFKELLIRHLQFDHPEIWAVRKSQTKWNFSDLLENPTEIRFIECTYGKLHLVDKAPLKDQTSFEAHDLDDLKVSFVLPRKHKKTSVFLEFKLPQPGYTTAFRLTGIAHGQAARWQDNKYEFDLDFEKLNPQKFLAFAVVVPELFTSLAPGVLPAAATNSGSGNVESATATNPRLATIEGAAATNTSVTTLPTSVADGVTTIEDIRAAVSNKVTGLFDVKLTGKGSLSRGITSDVTAKAQNFSIDAPNVGKISAPTAATTAKLYLDEHKFKWDELSLSVADVKLSSHGELENWLSPDTKYDAHFGGRVDDLKAAAKLVANQDALHHLSATDHWSGKAEVEVHVLGAKDKCRYETNLRLEDVMAKSILEKLPPEAKPVAGLLGLPDDAKVRGEVKFVPDESIEIKNAELPLTVGKVQTVGLIDLHKGTSDFSFIGKELSLSGVQQKLNEQLHSHGASAELPASVQMKLGGNFDLAGKFSTAQKTSSSNGIINLKNAQASMSDGSVVTSGISGSVKWKDDRISLTKVGGIMGGGTFQIDGESSSAPNSRIDLHLHAQNTQLEQLEAVLKMLRVDAPVLTDRHLYGKVKDLVIKVSGTAKQPELYLSAVPDDLYYQPPGLSRPLHARSGTIVYDHDQLSLSEVALLVRNDKVLLGMEIDNVSKAAVLNQVVVKTAGVDVSDVNYYLSSVLMPPPLKKAYSASLAQFKISGVHGRFGADLICKVLNHDVAIDGNVNLNNVGCKLGTLPVEKVSGVVSASGEQLLFHNVSGAAKASHFILDGKIAKYKQPDPWIQLQLAATIDPREVVQLLPIVGEQAQRCFRVSANSALEMKASVKGNLSKNRSTFSFDIPAKSDLRLVTDYGTFSQPPNEAVAIDGALSVEPDGVELSKTKVAIGDSVLTLSGSVSNAPKGAEPTECPIDLEAKSDKPIDLYKLVSLTNADAKKSDFGGTIDGALRISGTIGQPHPVGKIEIDKFSSELLGLKDLRATLALQQSGGHETGKLTVPAAHYKQLQVSNFSSDVTVHSPAGRFTSVISNGKGTIAGGTFTTEGSYNWADHKLSLNGSCSQIKANELASNLFNKPGEISGFADGSFTLSADLDSPKSVVSTLTGHGTVTVSNGLVSRFGQLQAKITQANLLRQGLFGFNFNNLLQSVYPVRTGHFRDLTGQFNMDKGVITINDIRYNGDDMRLWGNGKANLMLDTLVVDVAGKIPRVSSSVIGGPVGEVSKAFTFQKVMNVVTMKQLESLPSLPVLGEFAASNKPRTFSFKVMAPIDNPKLLAQSIEKSFHWLPTKPAASAHPVPGLEQ